MPGKESLRFLIEKNYASLRPSEKQVGDFVLKNMDELLRLGLSGLAAAAGVSQPTVVRFVKALGFSSYKEFKYRLIEEGAGNKEEGNRRVLYGYEITSGDDRKNIPSRIVATTIQMLEETLKSISTDTFERIIEGILKAKAIEICGVENSQTVCSDLCIKLNYLGLNCNYYQDSYMQRIRAGSLGPGDLAIGISYSGCSRDTVDAMKAAKEQGASTVAVTNFRDALIAQYADHVLCSTQEQFLYGDAIFSRTTQVAIADMIYLGVIVSDYERFAGILDHNSKMLRDKAYL